MNSKDYAIGDVVQLNSGGPPMTVTAITGGGGIAAVSWFDKNGVLYRDEFPLMLLKLYKEWE